MSTTDLTIRDTWLYHLTVNKGLSNTLFEAYKVDSQGYIEYLHHQTIKVFRQARKTTSEDGFDLYWLHPKGSQTSFRIHAQSKTFYHSKSSSMDDST